MLLTSQQRIDLDKAAKKKLPLFLSVEGLSISFQTEIIQVKDSHLIIENCIPPSYIRKIIDSKKFFIQLDMLRYQSEKISTDGKNIIFHFSELTATEETRSLQRISFTSEEKVVCQILNPYDKKTLLRKSILDLSANGVAIKTHNESQLFSRGLILDDIKILVDDSIFARTMGEVVYKRSIMDVRGGRFLQIGIKFSENIVSPDKIQNQ